MMRCDSHNVSGLRYSLVVLMPTLYASRFISAGPFEDSGPCNYLQQFVIDAALLVAVFGN